MNGYSGEGESVIPTGESTCVLTKPPPPPPRWSERAGVRGAARGPAAADTASGGGEPREGARTRLRAGGVTGPARHPAGESAQRTRAGSVGAGRQPAEPREDDRPTPAQKRRPRTRNRHWLSRRAPQKATSLPGQPRPRRKALTRVRPRCLAGQAGGRGGPGAERTQGQRSSPVSPCPPDTVCKGSGMATPQSPRQPGARAGAPHGRS